MHTSPEIHEIASALSKAQNEMTGAKKDSNNPFFKSKYADLAEVIRAISAPFANNGLSFVQSVKFKNGMVAVKTRIMHNSGQWIESDACELPPVKQDAQGYGSAITYAKRYSLQALAGIPSVDDDGNEAVKQVAPQETVKKSPAITKKLKAVKTMDELVELWKGMTSDQRKAHEDDKNKLKEMLSEAAKS